MSGTPAPAMPSVGRTVHYALPDGPNEGQCRPAIITHVHPHHGLDASAVRVNLHVFLDGDNDDPVRAAPGNMTRWVQHVEMGSQPGTWRWPPRT